MKAAEYAIDIARYNKAQLFALTVLDISKITYTASAFIASPIWFREFGKKSKRSSGMVKHSRQTHVRKI